MFIITFLIKNYHRGQKTTYDLDEDVQQPLKIPSYCMNIIEHS